MYIFNIFRRLGQLTMLAAVLFFIYEAGSNWVTKAQFGMRSLGEAWRSLCGEDVVTQTAEKALAYVSQEQWDSFLAVPAPLAVFILGIFFYLIFRILFALSGKDKSALL